MVQRTAEFARTRRRYGNGRQSPTRRLETLASPQGFARRQRNDQKGWSHQLSRNDLSQTHSSSDSDSSRMISFTVFDRTPFFEIIDSSFFVKFCKNVCFSFFTFNRILIFVESNFDFPSFFSCEFFHAFESLKIHAEFSRGGESCAHISFVKNKDFFLSLIAHHFFAFLAKLES